MNAAPPPVCEVALEVPVFDQFDGAESSACGTTSLAQILTFWNPARPYTHQEIDQDIRRRDIYNVPDLLAGYGRRRGFRAGLKSDASLLDLRRTLAMGVPVEVLIEPNEKKGDDNLHWVVATGFETDRRGRIKGLRLANPAHARRHTMPVKEFLDRWSRLEIFGVETGLNRVMLSFVPDDSRPIAGADGITRLAKDVRLPESGPFDFVSNSQPARVFGRGQVNIANGVATGNVGKRLGGEVQQDLGTPFLLLGVGGVYLEKAGPPVSWLGWSLRRIAGLASWGVGALGDGLAGP